MYRIDETLNLDQGQLESVIQLDDELRRIIARKHFTKYLEPAIIIDNYSSFRFSLYAITPDNLDNTDNISVGIIPLDMFPLLSLERNSCRRIMSDFLAKVDNTFHSDQLHRQVRNNTENLTPHQQGHVAKTAAVISESVIISATKDADGDRVRFTADTAYFRMKTIALTAAQLTLNQTMTALLYDVPEEPKEYQQFLTNITTVPEQWLNELYTMDEFISMDDEKELNLYSILSMPPYV